MSNFLITGYYFKGNLGDDLLMKVASSIFSTKNTKFIGIDSINIYNTSYIDELINWTDKLILFGGEVINHYFLDKLISIRTYSLLKFNKFIPFYAIGVSCNCDLDEIMSKVDIFETMIFRNKNDFDVFNNRLSNKHIFHLPDPVFYMLPDIPKERLISKLLQICMCSNKMYEVGLFLSQTAKDKDIIVQEVVKLINSLNYNFNLFTMCNGNIDNENDLLINKTINDNLVNKKASLYEITEDVVKNMNKLDFAICWRFHAHVLCIQYNIPFISISNTPKVINLMNELNLQNLVYNSSNIIDGFNYLLQNKNIIKLQLLTVYKKVYESICNMNQLVNNNLNIRNLPKYYIDIDQQNIYNKLINKYNIYKTEDNAINASILLYLITGKLKTSYQWGLTEKMNENNNIINLQEDIKWLIKEEIKKGDNSFYYKMSEYTNYNIDYTYKNGINIHYFNQNDMKGLHRAGWEYVINHLEDLATFNNDALLCDLYIDRTFHWNYDICNKLSIIPYRKKWIGFIHHTDNEQYTKHNIVELFNKKYFLESLECCKGLIVLSKYLKNKLMNILIKKGYYHIPVYVLYHPTEFVNSTFDIIEFEKKKEKIVIQIGAWYRKIDAIFRLQLGDNKLNFKKCALNGPAMSGYYNKVSSNSMANISRDCISRDDADREEYINDIELRSVEILNEVSANDFDKLLVTSIIFIYLIDGSAANTIIEAIVRNTPILINKIEPVVEYLGSGYPFYYDSMEEATEKLNNIKLIRDTNNYLKKMNKSFLKIETFINNFKKIII